MTLVGNVLHVFHTLYFVCLLTMPLELGEIIVSNIH
jgi:hypothetical protein